MKRCLYAASIFYLGVALSWAQNPKDLSNDEIVSVGTRIDDHEINRIASPVSLLSSEDIEARNVAHMSDLLRSLPGISVNRSGPGGALTQIRLRGSEASHVLVLIDGIEMANPTAGEFDFAGLRAADIRRVEILRGEQSALYGSDAIGGVINIITGAGDTETGMQFDVEGGSFETLDGYVGAVVPIAGARLSISGGGRTVEGYDISGLSGEKDGAKSKNLNIGVNNIVLGAIEMSAKFGLSRFNSDFDEDIDFDGRLNDTISETQLNRTLARLDARFDMVGFETLITASGQETITDTLGSFNSRSNGRRLNVTGVTKRELGTGDLMLLGEWESERYEITPNFALSPSVPKNNTAAIAADYTVDMDRLTLSGSVRHDFNDRFKDAFTWRVGGTYALNSIEGLVRASIGTGIKNPSLIELFGFFPESNFVGNPDLKPESSTGFNIGYDQYFLNRDFRLSINYFKSDLEDEIFTDFSSFPFLARNRSTKSEREGIELEAHWKLTQNTEFRGSATFLDATENGIEEIRRPEFLAGGTASWQISTPLQLTISVDHNGKQTDTDFAVFAPVRLDAFTLVGLSASYDIGENISLTGRVENLLDEDYQEVVGYASQSRGIYAGLHAWFD